MKYTYRIRLYNMSPASPGWSYSPVYTRFLEARRMLLMDTLNNPDMIFSLVEICEDTETIIIMAHAGKIFTSF